MRSRSWPLRTACPSFTGISMISPETSGAIFTSTSGWIFPVAVTSWVIAFRKALSVVIGIGFSRLREATMDTRVITISTAAPISRMSFFFREAFTTPIMNGPGSRRFQGGGQPPSAVLQLSEIDSRTDAERPGLVGQVTYACAESTLSVQRQQGLLVGQVVDEECRVPSAFEDPEAQVDDVIRRQLRIECESVLRERTADTGGSERQHFQAGRRTEVLVTDLSETVADMLVDAGDVAHPARRRPAVGRRGGCLVLRHARHAGTAPDP